jgi:hypothetical protein
MTICIYHGGCPDGFTAAWIVARALPDVTLVEGRYGEPAPDCTGENRRAAVTIVEARSLRVVTGAVAPPPSTVDSNACWSSAPNPSVTRQTRTQSMRRGSVASTSR